MLDDPDDLEGRAVNCDDGAALQRTELKKLSELDTNQYLARFHILIGAPGRVPNGEPSCGLNIAGVAVGLHHTSSCDPSNSHWVEVLNTGGGVHARELVCLRRYVGEFSRRRCGAVVPGGGHLAIELRVEDRRDLRAG
ncbi:hypothetical protein MTE01_32300 [Microbacterium testaceum]|uniref:Uncharacterized protein n=1 Tax=Microbacterium testaceum TaxID=2033 RepID=A0A4Y3QPS6_MICTE|nr:hypothetical protein MTE01_32300 [Microbacterium testaceum]